MHAQVHADTRWPFEVRPLTPTLGAEIIGMNLARGVDDALFRSIHQAFLKYQVLLFGTQDLPPGRQVEFARHFGEVQIHVMTQYHAGGHPELYRLSNLDENGNPNGKHPDKGTLAWHTDGSWRRVTGQATIIYAEVVAGEGGETHFCDMYGAYERLSPRSSGSHLRTSLDAGRVDRLGQPLPDASRHRLRSGGAAARGQAMHGAGRSAAAVTGNDSALARSPRPSNISVRNVLLPAGCKPPRLASNSKNCGKRGTPNHGKRDHKMPSQGHGIFVESIARFSVWYAQVC